MGGAVPQRLGTREEEEEEAAGQSTAIRDISILGTMKKRK